MPSKRRVRTRTFSLSAGTPLICFTRRAYLRKGWNSFRSRSAPTTSCGKSATYSINTAKPADAAAGRPVRRAEGIFRIRLISLFQLLRNLRDHECLEIQELNAPNLSFNPTPAARELVQR